MSSDLASRQGRVSNVGRLAAPFSVTTFSVLITGNGRMLPSERMALILLK